MHRFQRDYTDYRSTSAKITGEISPASLAEIGIIKGETIFVKPYKSIFKEGGEQMELNKRALGFALGIFYAVAIYVMTMLALWSDKLIAKSFLLSTVGSLMPGYLITVEGAIIGLCYGFVVGFGSGWVIAFLYNYFVIPKKKK